MTRPVLAPVPWLQRAAFSAARGIARHTPPRAQRLLAHLLGTLTWLLDSHGRRTVRRNLAHFVPASCSEALSRTVWRNYVGFYRYVFDTLRMDRLSETELDDDHLTIVDPWRVFHHAPLSGPAILLIVHCHWELTCAVLHRRGLTNGIESVALGSGDPHIDALFERLRNAVQTRSVLLDQAPLASLRALKAGKVLLLAGDRDYSRSGLVVPFAGEPMAIPRGPAALAVQTGAPIIPLFLARSEPSRLMLLVGRPLRAAADRPKSEQIEPLTHALAEVMARFISAAPAQWIAFHDAWQIEQTPHAALELTPLGSPQLVP